MTREETKMLLTETAHLFPRFANPDEDKKLKVDLWTEALEEYDYESLHAALMSYARNESKGFPPSVGQLIELTGDPLLPRDHEYWGIE